MRSILCLKGMCLQCLWKAGLLPLFKGCNSIGSGEDICFIPLLFSLRGVFYVWDKKVVDMSIQDQFSSVLCLCCVRARQRRGWMPSWLGLEQVACICKIAFTLSIQSILRYVHASGFCSEERLILFYTFLCLNCFYRCSFDTPGLLVWVFEGGLYFWI